MENKMRDNTRAHEPRENATLTAQQSLGYDEGMLHRGDVCPRHTRKRLKSSAENRTIERGVRGSHKPDAAA